MKAIATLTNYRQSPRKVRVVGDLVKGKRVPLALVTLDLMPKRASLPIKKLILSAVSNAKGQFSVDMQDLIVKNITIDKGVVLHRWLPKARGRATPLRKKCSHVTVTLVTPDEIGSSASKMHAHKDAKVVEKNTETAEEKGKTDAPVKKKRVQKKPSVKKAVKQKTNATQ